VASKQEHKAQRGTAKQEKAVRRAVEEARRARAAQRRRAASYRPPRPPRRDIWTDGRSFRIEGDKGKELRLSVAKARELLAGGGYVLRRIRLRTNLPLERQAAQVTQPSSRRARYYPKAGPVTKGGTYTASNLFRRRGRVALGPPVAS
jgi:hypothetical protein